MLERRRKAMLAALAGAVAGTYPWACHSTSDGEWPSRTVTMVVPFPPGGGDGYGRPLAREAVVDANRAACRRAEYARRERHHRDAACGQGKA